MSNAYLPTESQIRQACSRIRASWDTEVREFRHRRSDVRLRSLAQRIFRERNGSRRRLAL